MVLSKSSLLKGFQCKRQLYLYKFHYDLRDEISESTQAIFDTGHTVGELAQKLFPGGVNCSAGSAFEYQDCVNKTSAALKSGAEIIYEAGFIYNDIVVICDILVIKNNNFHIYEVKSSTEVKDVNILDAAIQYYVVSNAGYEVKDISVVVINSGYIRKGELEINKLFKTESVKKDVVCMQEEITPKIKEFKKMLSLKKDPGSDLGPQCEDPYACSFLGYCWRDIPEYSVFNISGLKSEKKFELYNRGIISIEDIPEDYPLSTNQRIQVTAHKEGRNFLDENALREFMDDIELPVMFMDFETIMPAVPLFDNSHPYQQIPFQFSVHRLDEKNKLTHTPFLAEADGDPRPAFIKNLLEATKGKEDILVYNSPFERTRLAELGKDFPSYKKELEQRVNRIKDLMTPFQKKWYYTPEMEGSYSIKHVLPALVPDLSYDDLEIAEGGTASRMFESLYYQPDKKIAEIIRRNLLEYCKTDTLAMVEIYRRLSVLRAEM